MTQHHNKTHSIDFQAYPRLKARMGADAIDIRSLYADHHVVTFDPSFSSTASCESKITFIDGEKGMLLHRGYSIEELAETGDYLDLCYLLWFGTLPSRSEYDKFIGEVTSHTMLHEQMNYFYRGFRRDAHPMAIMIGVVGALAAFYHDSLDISDPEQRYLSFVRLIAKMPTIAAWAHAYAIGKPFIYPKNSLSYEANFLYMTFGYPTEDYQPSETICRAMNRIFILHADHEQNASTSTVRMAGSSGANPFACIAAGISSLWGPAHGGANEAVLKMLSEIGDKSRIKEFIQRAKDKNDPFRLMGFGHRVYKNYDPRATVLRKSCHEVLGELGIKEPLLDIALELEKIALEDSYFVERKLFPNVDFYSGIILRAIGFPDDMFTALFSLARTAGWMAQWKEMVEDPKMRIARPRQLYTGEAPRRFIPLDKRAP